MCKKNSSSYLEKLLSFAVLNTQRAHFLRYLRGFRYFSNFQLLPELGRSKSVPGSLFAFLTKIWPKTIYRTTQTQNFKFDLFDLWLPSFGKIHKRLWGHLEVSQTRSHVVPWLYFNLIRLLFTAKPARTENQEFCLRPDLWHHRWRHR